MMASTSTSGTTHTPHFREGKLSKYSLVPLPAGEPRIPLREGSTEIGRRLLTEQMQITSTSHPKKMSVSRHQVTLTIVAEKIVLQSVGLNVIIVNQSGQCFNPEKNQSYTLTIGDSFTLCGSHFPFKLVLTDSLKGVPLANPPKLSRAPPTVAKPEPQHWPSSSGAGGMTFYNYNTQNFPQTLKKNGTEKNPPVKAAQPVKKETSPTGATKKVKQDVKQEVLKLNKQFSIGDLVEVYRPKLGKKMQGTIKNYDEQKNKYCIKYDAKDVEWEIPERIAVVSKMVRKGSNLSLSASQQRKRRKRQEDVAQSEDSSSEESSDDAQPERRTSRRRTTAATSYFEWPSDSSSDNDEVYAITYTKGGKYKKTNWSDVEQTFSKNGRTAILYSDICLKHYVPNWHLERPARVTQIMEGLRDLHFRFPNNLDLVSDIEPVQKDLLVKVHDENYIIKMESQTPESDTPMAATQFSLDERAEEDCDTFMSHFSFDAALTAAGSVCQAIDLVVKGTYRNVFCAVRPPGHHAGKKGHTAEASSQGYCLINNIAVGAYHSVLNHGFKKVAVVDFDVHHGNGTEEILQNNDNFLFVSVHVGDIYPGTGVEDANRASNVLNISLRPGDGSDVFRRVFTNQVLPRLNEFQPEILLLSSGFDGHKKDPTDDGLKLEEPDYAWVTGLLMGVATQWCGGKLVSVLEGGYHLPSLRKCVKEHVIGLMKDAPPVKETPAAPAAASNNNNDNAAVNEPSSQADLSQDIVHPAPPTRDSTDSLPNPEESSQPLAAASLTATSHSLLASSESIIDIM